jgi:hypothetical protein
MFPGSEGIPKAGRASLGPPDGAKIKPQTERPKIEIRLIQTITLIRKRALVSKPCQKAENAVKLLASCCPYPGNQRETDPIPDIMVMCGAARGAAS